MKNFLLATLLISSVSVTAQNSISLKKGQKINVVNTNYSRIDMGMGMQMINNVEVASQLNVIDEKDNEYKLTTTLLKSKGSMELMGQKKEYDSEHPKDSSEAKSMAESFNKPMDVTLNKFTAAVKVDKKAVIKETEQMGDIMNAIGNEAEDAAVAGAFLIIPKGKKTGDSWTETDSTKQGKSTKNYTISSIDKNNVRLLLSSDSEMNTTMEVQGTNMDVLMNTKTSGEIYTDLKTGVVSKRSMNSEITGTLGIMGQSMPITGTSKLVSTFTVE